MTYRGYLQVHDPVGQLVTNERALEQIADAINADVREQGDPFAFGEWTVRMHLGIRQLRLDARSAHEARVNWKSAHRWFAITGYTRKPEMTSALRRAL